MDTLFCRSMYTARRAPHFEAPVQVRIQRLLWAEGCFAVMENAAARQGA